MRAERLAAKLLQDARAENQTLAEIDALELRASVAEDRRDHVARARWLSDALSRALTASGSTPSPPSL